MARRQHVSVMLVGGVMTFLLFTYFMSSGPAEPYPTMVAPPDTDSVRIQSDISSNQVDLGIPDSILKGGSIAPKLENATAKAELGRASWKLLHTMMGRFPENPTPEDSLALKTYIQLFGRLYPCGDCAEHFRQMLQKYPPQTSSRNAAAGWACFVHNVVNKRLKKPEFDCNKIGDFYDCGCGEEDKKKTGDSSTSGKTEDLKERTALSLEKEGLTRGG